MVAKKKTQEPKKGCEEKAQIFLRIMLGLFFLFAGLPKLLALFGGNNPLGGFSVAIWLSWLVAIGEVGGGLALVLGMLRMPVGIVLSIIMVVAIILTLSKGGQDWQAVVRTIVTHVFYIAALATVAAKSDNWCLGKC